MTHATERRLLQAAAAFACLVPLLMGGLSVIQGPDILHAGAARGEASFDSHFRYLSGLLLGIGFAFAALIPRIERSGSAFRLLTLIVVVGGLARLWSALQLGLPGHGHVFGLVMELVVVPALMLWQARVARNSEPPRPLV
jgi:hypothetical protein